MSTPDVITVIDVYEISYEASGGVKTEILAIVATQGGYVVVSLDNLLSGRLPDPLGTYQGAMESLRFYSLRLTPTSGGTIIVRRMSPEEIFGGVYH
jgi:hypothetical protein